MDPISPSKERAVQKQQARDRIELELGRASKSVAQIKRENESFALSPSVARIRVDSARRTV